MEKYDDYCDTELCLSPGGPAASRRQLHSSNSNNTINSGSLCKTIDKSEGNHQQITVFYGGRMCTCDVTEIQARAIICMAKRDMEERMARYTTTNNNNSDGDSSSESSTQPPQLINPGLSMKRSLHQFLEKRKARISSP